MPTYQKIDKHPDCPDFERFVPEGGAKRSRELSKAAEPVERIIYSKDKVVVDTPHAQFLRRMLAHQWVQAVPAATARPAHAFALGGHRAATGWGAAVAAVADVPYQKQGYSNDWDKHFFDNDQPIRRVNAYTFRGDSRTIVQLKAVGGFTSNLVRTDESYLKKVAVAFRTYMSERHGKTVPADAVLAFLKNQGQLGRDFAGHFRTWQAVREHQGQHFGRHIQDPTHSDLVSTSRSIDAAGAFASGAFSGGKVGYVYAVRVRGGLSIAGGHGFNRHAWENEIAVAGSIPFQDICGFRQMGLASQMTGAVNLRKGFRDEDKAACDEVFRLLSGHPQERTGRVN